MSHTADKSCFLIASFLYLNACGYVNFRDNRDIQRDSLLRKQREDQQFLFGNIIQTQRISNLSHSNTPTNPEQTDPDTTTIEPLYEAQTSAEIPDVSSETIQSRIGIQGKSSDIGPAHQPPTVVEREFRALKYLAGTGSAPSTTEPLQRRPVFSAESGSEKVSPNSSITLASENGAAPLSHLRIHYPNKDPIAKSFLNELIPVMEQLPDLKLLIVASPGDTELRVKISRLPDKVNSRIAVFPYNESIDLWTQDGSKPLQGSQGLTTLKPRVSQLDRRFSNAVLANRVKLSESLNNKGVLHHEEAPFSFEGGNIIVGAKHIFVGPDVVKKLVADKLFEESVNITHAQAVSYLTKTLGKPVEVIGKDGPDGKYQIDFHIDLSMAIATNHKTGRETALVGSPALAARILTQKFQATDTLPISEEGLLSGPDGLRPLSKRENDLMKILMQSTEAYAGWDLTLAERQRDLDQVATQLSKLGYDIVRVPDFNIRPPIGSPLNNYRLDECNDMMNYTNVIFSGDHVLTPQLGIQAWDDHMRQVWKDMGYTPIEFVTPQKSLQKQGGLRCLSETFRN